jgi:K(+)-stimulated pyrophosphate-energized sodium pump
MTNGFYLIPLAGALALIFAFARSAWIRTQDTGTPEMAAIAGHIREGAMAFLVREYRVLAVFVVVVAALLAVANASSASRFSTSSIRGCSPQRIPKRR